MSTEADTVESPESPASPESLATAHLAWAKRLAGWMAARYPRAAADDVESAAILGLWVAATRYDAGRGAKFKTFAVPHIRGAVIEAVRKECLLGYRRSSSSGTPRRKAFLEPTADSLPVGWELESEDWVNVYAKRTRYPGDLRAYFLNAGATMAAISRAAGVSEARVSQRISECLEELHLIAEE